METSETTNKLPGLSPLNAFQQSTTLITKSLSNNSCEVKPEPPCRSMTHGVDEKLKRDDSIQLSGAVGDKLKLLRNKFAKRTSQVKEHNANVSSSSDIEENNADSGVKVKPLSGPDSATSEEKTENEEPKRIDINLRIVHFIRAFYVTNSIDPQSKFYIVWLGVVSMAVIYNYISIPFRETFTVYDTSHQRSIWFSCDYVADLLYVIDLVFVKTRMQFVSGGAIETNTRQTAKNYVHRVDFKMDLLALLPFDIFYFAAGVRPMLRFPRLLKIKVFWEMFDRMDRAAKNGHIVRITRTIVYMLYLIHVEACGFHLVSKLEGFGTNNWVYDDKKGVNAYIFSFYLAMKTATSIGNNPKPTNTTEYVFMTCYWLAGVFVFAILIGQIRDIFQAANANKTTYRKSMDDTILYLKSLNVPEHIISKVRRWFSYNWEQQKTLDENVLLEGLPHKLKTDMAIHVHYNTLSKSSFFQDCDRTLISDLILKLIPVLYLPGDYICKKGEIGQEMYIVMNGQVEVVGGPKNSIVFVTLNEGSVFGEISLMSLSGGNRRTADVRSKGFSTLFTLSKNDFMAAMQDYPQAYIILRKKAKKILNKDKKPTVKEDIAKEIIKERTSTPQLMKVIGEAVRQKRITVTNEPTNVKAESMFTVPSNDIEAESCSVQNAAHKPKSTQQESKEQARFENKFPSSSVSRIRSAFTAKKTRKIGPTRCHTADGRVRWEQKCVVAGTSEQPNDQTVIQSISKDQAAIDENYMECTADIHESCGE